MSKPKSYLMSRSSPSYGSIEDLASLTEITVIDRQEENMKLISDETLEGETFYNEMQTNTKYFIQSYNNEDLDLKILINSLEIVQFRLMIYYLLCTVTLGLAYLVFNWFEKWKISFLYTKNTINQSSHILIIDQYSRMDVVKKNIFIYPLFDSCNEIVAYFDYHHMRFVYTPLSKEFELLSELTNPMFDEILTNQDGQSTDKKFRLMNEYGHNELYIEDKNVFELLFEEILNPFYAFQVFSITLWSIDDYYYYASCIFIISVISIVLTLVEIKKNLNKVREMAALSIEVHVYRDLEWFVIDSKDLVIGDVYLLDNLDLIPCDSLLIQGECLVNEAMLTGESIPVTKMSCEDSKFLNSVSFHSLLNSEYSKFLLFSGTNIIRSKPNFLSTNVVSRRDLKPRTCGMVIRTGFNTIKGNLIVGILYPKPMTFEFYNDSFKFIGAMFLIAICGFFVSLFALIKLQKNTGEIIKKALDLITIVVPPALPATMSIGLGFAINRLRSKQIFCTSPSRVNIAGKIDIVCFDKTGTLTEEGLNIYGVIEVNDREFEELKSKYEKIKHCDLSMSHLMATCHAVKYVHTKLVGDPLELQMLGFTNWVYEEGCISETINDMVIAVTRPPDITKLTSHEFNEYILNNEEYYELAILKIFDFTPDRRRMSVITKLFNSDKVQIYTKGAPEVIELCCDKSSIPDNYHEILDHYAHKGYRIIACSGKSLEMNYKQIKNCKQDELETDQQFLGFIIFENLIKVETIPSLYTLAEANIPFLMCTGDNIITSTSVAKECNMINNDLYVGKLVKNTRVGETHVMWESFDGRLIDPLISKNAFDLSMTGTVFKFLVSNYDKEYIKDIIVGCKVYARMAPDDKKELVEILQYYNYCVGFCGDGSNDCGALKAADVGLSLSDAEASVAAPLTSRIPDISSFIQVIMEGRAALSTSFSCFKYMGLYSIIQFCSVILLYFHGSNLGDFQFLYFDLVLILPIAVFMSHNKAYGKLYYKPPSSSLISIPVMTSFITQCIIQVSFQVIAYCYVINQPWFVAPSIEDEMVIKNYLNSILFFVSGYQYIFSGLVLSAGTPHRNSNFKNIPFMVTLFILSFTTLFPLFIDVHFITGKLELEIFHGYTTKFIILAIIASNSLYAYLTEHLFIYPLIKALNSLKNNLGKMKMPDLEN